MKRREPLSNTQLLMSIAIGIFIFMYAAAIIGLGGGFLKFQQIFDLLNDNAYLIIIGCALTVVMIGGACEKIGRIGNRASFDLCDNYVNYCGPRVC